MRSFIVGFLLFLSLVAKAQVPTPDHVVVVIFENKSYSNFIGNYTLAPYLNSLADDAKGALFTQSYSLIHHSQPNYLILFSGSDQGVTDNDRPPFTLPFTTSNLGANLLNKGKTFVGYAEDMPFVGDDNDDDGLPTPLYARKHNPWVNWQDASVNGIPSSLNQPFSSFPASSNYSSLPTVAFVIPNLTNDMHDGDWQTALTIGDSWLQTNLDSYVQWAKTHNSLLIITWDEDNDDATNQIATIFIGGMVKHGQYDEVSLQNSMTGQTGIDHSNVLRTIEEMYGLPHSAKSGNLNTGTASVDPITDIWDFAVPIELLSFSASATEEGVKVNWVTASQVNNDFFTIENSVNGNDFTLIGIVKGAGTVHQRLDYSYVDENPLIGKSYYRLGQTDFDKKKSYSEVVSVTVNTKPKASIDVYPNPSNGESFQLSVRNFHSSNLSISIYDLLGQLVETQLISIPETEDHKIYFKSEQILRPGIYILIVSDGQTYVAKKNRSVLLVNFLGWLLISAWSFFT